MQRSRFWCEECQDTVEWVPVNTVCTMTGVDRRTVYNWMNRCWIHSRKLPNGWRVACLRSLEAKSEEEGATNMGRD